MPTIDPKLELKLALIPDALARLKAQLGTSFTHKNIIKTIHLDTVWSQSNEGKSYWYVLSILVDHLKRSIDKEDLLVIQVKYPETYKQILPLLKEKYSNP